MDENLFHEFAIEAHRIIDQFSNMVSSFKETYLKCCANCVTISQQLFIQIESGIMFNYTTFIESLVNFTMIYLNLVFCLFGYKSRDL